MREIKFRVWNISTTNPSKMFYISPLTHPYIPFSAIAELDDYRVMQYTGLKDSKGKEIYEGDLMFTSKYSDKPRVVRWNEEEAHFELGLQGNSERDKAYLMIFAVNLEVIGNIYENPELLKVEK